MPSSSTKTKRKHRQNSNVSSSKSNENLSDKNLNTDNSLSASPSPSNNNNKSSKSSKDKSKARRNRVKNNSFDKEEMNRYVLWRRPFQTFYYFILELFEISVHYLLKFLNQRKLVALSTALILLVTSGFFVEGAHLPILLYLRKKVVWCFYWVGLGVASSIGLGTGLHTFLLYLGPFIAQVTLAAYECNSLKFPEPPYPDNIVCPLFSQDVKLNSSEINLKGSAEVNPDDGLFSSTAAMAIASSISFLSIMAKVRLESFMWGAGTAIGELPPYFMARASALSSIESKKVDSDKDEEMIEFEELLEAEKKGSKNLNLLDRVRLYVFKLVKKVGFWGILLCASIPNPLFDLAGITCGHFLVKFWTFFGATLIGKAIIKMHIQKMFVIFLFSQHHLDNLFGLISKIPYVGQNLQPLFQEWLDNEKQKLHNSKNTDGFTSGVAQSSESIISWLLGKIVLLMILFFVVSIINSLAQRRYKRLTNKNSLLLTNKIAND